MHLFTLDHEIGAFVLSQENVQMPETGKIYSHERIESRQVPHRASRDTWTGRNPTPQAAIVRVTSGRWCGFSPDAGARRCLFVSADEESAGGKLRLLYEANPLAFLAEVAGGLASDGKQRVMEKQPKTMHERTPLIIGSKKEVEKVLEFLKV